MSVARGNLPLERVARGRAPGVLARMATTGIYLVSGVSRDLQRAARGRAASEGTTLRAVLVKALAEYAAGRWTPRPDHESGAAR